jgi:Zn-dependent protease with chaperone function
VYCVSGKYFDGKSSQSQIVKVDFDCRLDELSLQNYNFKAVWRLQDVICESCGNCVEIRKKDSSDEYLSIDDREFRERLFGYLLETRRLSVYQRLVGLSFRKHLLIAAAILAVIVLGYFFAVPYIAEKSVAIIPETFDEKLGDSFISEFALMKEQDVEKTLLLNEFAQELKLNNHRNLHFRVINSPTVNAFALPNGEIIIYTGILEKMDNYTELAGLIGHEATHVNNRHSMKMLCRNLAGYIFVSALFSDVNGIVTVIAENAHSLNTLSYSRTFESEADEQAVYLMLQNRINPQGIVSLFEMLDTEAGYDNRFLEYVQTHPLTAHRIEKIQQIITENNASYTDNPKLKSLFLEMKKEID